MTDAMRNATLDQPERPLPADDAGRDATTRIPAPTSEGNRRRTLFSVFDQRDQYAALAASSMMLLPLLGGYFFVR